MLLFKGIGILKVITFTREFPSLARLMAGFISIPSGLGLLWIRTGLTCSMMIYWSKGRFLFAKGYSKVLTSVSMSNLRICKKLASCLNGVFIVKRSMLTLNWVQFTSKNMLRKWKFTSMKLLKIMFLPQWWKTTCRIQQLAIWLQMLWPNRSKAEETWSLTFWY